MIPVTELRVGNYLLHNGKIVSVKGIVDETDTYHESFLIWYEAYAFNISEFKQIPLTPEILERCGFQKGQNSSTIGYGATYFNGDTIIEERNGGYELFASEWTIGETFYYLHELQNICLDFFKFELEIKELQHA